jgi:DNA-directed RNA polymerase subunit RPC12/RpoP
MNNIKKEIYFCEKCTWYKVVKDDKDNDIVECPKCKIRLWNIYQIDYYENGKYIYSEAELSDGDENFILQGTIKEIQTILNKGAHLIKYGR